MPRLLIERPGAQTHIYELAEKSTVSIGRAASNQIILPHSSVSRNHAILDGTGPAWVVIDQHSANGVLVNRARLQRATLKNNDLISLGDCNLRFEDAVHGTVVAQARPELATHLTQILDQQSIAKLLAQPRPKSPAGWGEVHFYATAPIDELQRENRLLSLLYQVSRELANKVTVDEVTQCVLDLVLQIEGVERGYAMLLTEESLRDSSSRSSAFSFLPAIIRYRRPPGPSTPQLILSRVIINQVMESKGPLLITDAQGDARFTGSESMARSGMQSAMCAPLASRDRLFGLLYVDNLSKRGTFTPDELEIFAVIAAQAGLAIDRVLAKSQVQRQGIHLSALERFLSPSISKKIAAEAADIRLGGESQRITILFADVRGFTTLAERLTPREVVALLNDFYTRMTNVIFQHDGTLDKYLGDGIMALFGAPFALQNDAEAAVRAAIGMQQSLCALNQCSDRAPLQIGVGIHTGEAVVGFLGTEHRIDYTAIGDTVNVASRLTSQAHAGQIVISAATQAHLPATHACRQLPAMKLKGRTELIGVSEILWSGPLDTHAAGESSSSVTPRLS